MKRKLFLFYIAIFLVTKKQSALYIHDCSSEVKDVTEDTDVNFTCGPYINRIEWYFLHDNRLENYIGHCNSSGCESPSGSLFVLQQKTVLEQGYESTLYIKNLTRHQEFSLRCTDGNEMATCKLRVTALPILRNCDVWIRDWQVFATCEVEHMYVSDDRYSCRWSTNNAELPSIFVDPLTEYWLDTRAYQKGICYVSHSLFTGLGNYAYRLNIDPGLWNVTVKTISIVPPGDPMYTCREVVQEGYNVSCTCTSSNPGTPPAKFVWDDLNTDILHVLNVQRENSGSKHICSMTWGPNRKSSQTVLTLKVTVPFSIVPQTCSVQLSRWKVHGVCTIQWLNKISDSLECRWRFSYQYL